MTVRADSMETSRGPQNVAATELIRELDTELSHTTMNFIQYVKTSQYVNMSICQYVKTSQASPM